MKILLLNNNFCGSYGSNQYFYGELVEACQELGLEYKLVSNTDDAITAFEQNDIGLSLCLGIYRYTLHGVPLYDLYQVPHYQWISDNPLKFSLDRRSPNIKYIFIDAQFPDVAGQLEREPLILPLGYSRRKRKDLSPKKVNGVFFPGQIRNLDTIRAQIDQSEYRNEIYAFIEAYDYDTSYIEALQLFTKSFPVKKKASFFRLTNSYIRTDKRIKAIASIHELPVYIAGENYGNRQLPQDIRFIGKYDYTEIEKLMNRYRYVLNVDPNYHACIHERVLRGVNAGSVSISNQNKEINPKKGFPLSFRFDGKSSIDHLLQQASLSLSDIYNQQCQFISGYSWRESLKRILYDFTQNQGKRSGQDAKKSAF